MRFFKLSFFILLTLILVNCANTTFVAPPVPENTKTDQYVFESFTTVSEDGLNLQGYRWMPTSSPQGVVVITHGLRDHALRYAELAESLATNGLVVYAQDLRGFGRSEGERQRFDSMTQVTNDLDRIILRAQKDFPGLKIFAFGHSLGGLITTEYALVHQKNLAGMVLSGPALKLGDDVSGFSVFVVRILGFVLPSLSVQPLEDTYFVRTEEAQTAFRADTLISFDNLPARSAAATADAIDNVQTNMEKITLPFLITHSSADKITNIEGSRQLAKRAGSADKLLLEPATSYHDQLHEPEKAEFIQAVQNWILTRLDK